LNLINVLLVLSGSVAFLSS
jgi:hypothetical protein